MHEPALASLRGVNAAKVLKTVRGSIKRSIYYLASSIPYDLSSELVSSGNSRLHQLCEEYPVLGVLIEFDSKIRATDDLLDDDLGRQVPKPLHQMRKVIEDFSAD